MSDIPNDNLKNHECANENPKDIKFTKLFKCFMKGRLCIPDLLIHKRRAMKILSLSLQHQLFTIE